MGWLYQTSHVHLEQFYQMLTWIPQDQLLTMSIWQSVLLPDPICHPAFSNEFSFAGGKRTKQQFAKISCFVHLIICSSYCMLLPHLSIFYIKWRISPN